MGTTLRGKSIDSDSYTSNDDGTRSLTETYLVVADSAQVGALEVSGTSGLPVLYQTYQFGGELDLGMKVVRVNPERSSISPFEWKVTIEYANETKYDVATVPESPLERPPEVSLDFEEATVPIQGFYNDSGTDVAYESAVQNSAGAPTDEIPERRDARLVMRITKNYSSLDLATYLDINNSINEDTIFGADPRTLRLVLSAQKRREEGITYWSVSFEFRHNPETWDYRFVDRGPYENDAGTLLWFRDETTGDQINKLLDGEGLELGAGEDPVFLTKTIYKVRSFGQLGLNNVFD